MLKHQRDIRIVAASGKSENTILKIHRLNPNVILLDLGLRSLNSLHVVEVVKKEFPDAKIIVMDLAPVQADIARFVKAGASGFILKDTTSDDFISTIRAVAEGENILPALLTDSLFSRIIEHALASGKMMVRESVRMTKREREVVGLVAEGLSNKDIARRLHVATHTVKSHLYNIMEKLALHRRLENENFAYTESAFKAVTQGISLTNQS